MCIFSKKGNAGTTFSDFKLKAPLDPGNPQTSVENLREAVRTYKDDRFNYYQKLMRRRSDVVNGLPYGAGALAVIGILFTAGAVVARTLGLAKLVGEGADLVMMAVAVVAYALMSAGLLYERLTESSGGYFRAIATIVAIRELWTAYQFDEIGRSLAPKDTDGAKEIERWHVPIKEFCKALDAIVAKEMTDWQAAYEATAKLRSDTANEGLKAVITELKASADAAATSAKEAAKKADEAATALAATRAPATLNLSLGAATTAGTAIIKIDGTEVAKGTNQRSFSIGQLTQGVHQIRIEFTPSANGSAMAPYEKAIDLKGGINDATITVA